MSNLKAGYLLKSWQHIFYSMARAGGALVNLVILQWAMFYYVPPEGEGVMLMPLLWFGVVMFFGRLIDAAADPFVGFWSDRTNTRWGRRIPFITFGSLPMVLVFIMLWFPPVNEISNLNIIYFALMAGLYCFLYTVVFCPYNALLAEMTGDLHERVTISTWTAFFSLMGAVIVALAAPFIIEELGFKFMGIAIGLIALIMLYGPVVSIKEKSRTVADEITFSFIESLRHTFKNKPFMYYLIAMIFFQLGGNAIIIAAPYFVTEILEASRGDMTYVMGSHLAVVFLTFPFINKLLYRFGKRNLFCGALILMTIMLPLLYFVNRIYFPIPLLLQGVIVFALAGIPMSIIYVLPNTIVADTIDYDRVLTGKSRSAMYFGVQGVFHKTAVGLSSVMVTFLFNKFGFSAEVGNPQGIYLVGPVAGFLALIGFLIFRKYPKNDYLEEALKQYDNKKLTLSE